MGIGALFGRDGSEADMPRASGATAGNRSHAMSAPSRLTTRVTAADVPERCIPHTMMQVFFRTGVATSSIPLF
jgi:hypothetical protein